MVINKTIKILGETINAYIEDNNNPNKVVLLHGFNSSWHSFDRLINEKYRNFDIAAFDFPGCGLSSNNHQITIEHYQKIAAEFIKKIGFEGCIVISHSLGSVSALYCINNNLARYGILSSPYNYYSNFFSASFIDTVFKAKTKKAAIITFEGLKSQKRIKNISASLDFIKTLFDNNRFRKLTRDQMFNREYVNKNVREEFKKTNKFIIVTGTTDPYVQLRTCAKVANDTGTEVIAFSRVAHTFWKDINDSQLQIVIGLIEREFEKISHED